MKKLLGVATILLLAASFSYAQTTGTATSTLNLTVGNEAVIQITANPALASGTTTFSDYLSTTSLLYFIRTNQTTGSGSITVQATSDFSPVGGPSIASPVNGDKLTYTCAVSTPGTQCTGTQTVTTLNTAYPVATFGINAQSAKAGNTGSVSWDLSNDPAYKTGSYTADLTFTISAS